MINLINNSNITGLTHLEKHKNNFKYRSFKARERIPQTSTFYTSSCVEIYFSSGEFGSSQDSFLEMMTSLLLITGPNECDYHLSERSYTMIIVGLGHMAAVHNKATFVPVK